MVVIAPTPSAAGRSLAFSLRGEAQVVLDLEALRAATPESVVRVFEPYEGQAMSFRALPFDRGLEQVYGSRWREEEELLFTCSDGYQPGFPVQRLLEHRAWLAFERVGSDHFSLLKHESGESKRIGLAPFYLVWSNLDDPVVREEGDYGWPYQLVGVDLIRARDRFPAMTPANDATAEVLAGFKAFRIHCSRCHTINGEGGKIGPELNIPVSPLEYRDLAWLRQWIDDPHRLLPTARMPALNPSLRNRARTIDEILAYLGAMAKRKLIPQGAVEAR